MKKSIIVSYSSNHVIGNDNKILWHIPEDNKNFNDLILSRHVIVGRKTFELFGKSIVAKQIIVLSKDDNYIVPLGIIKASGIDEAFAVAEKNMENEVFIIGGGEIFDQTIELVDRIYLTKLMDRFDGDTFFPAIDFSKYEIPEGIDRVIYNNFIGEKKYSYEYMVLEKINS
jgi:dihydrofolate reductase